MQNQVVAVAAALELMMDHLVTAEELCRLHTDQPGTLLIAQKPEMAELTHQIHLQGQFLLFTQRFHKT